MSNQVEDAAQGEAGANAEVPTTAQVMEALWTISEVARIHEPETFPVYAAVAGACVTAVAQGADPLRLADALAGGDEYAAARLFDRSISPDPDFLPLHTRDALEELLGTVRTKVRAHLIEVLPFVLTEDELSLLVRTIAGRFNREASALPTFVPGVRLWFADLDEAEKRQLIEFVIDPADGLIAQVSEVMEAAVAAGVVTRQSAAPSTATA